MGKRLTILFISIILAAVSVWFLSGLDWSPKSAYVAYAILVLLFFGLMVSNQQYEEDLFSKIERVGSALLFSYIVFFRFMYAPLSHFFFGSLIKEASFVASVLSLVLFMIFFFLFGTTFLVINKYSQVGFLSGLRMLNNDKMFLFLRCLFLPAVVIFLMLFLRNSFFSMNNSYYINTILPPSTCNWTYTEYGGFSSLKQAVAGRDACLYNYAQNRKDPRYCKLIQDKRVFALCGGNRVP